MAEERRASGREQFAIGGTGGEGDAREQVRRRRRGNGEEPVGAADEAAADFGRGGEDAIRLELLDEGRVGGDVADRVHRADLVEVHLGDRHAVGLRLRSGDQFVDGLDVGLGAI